MSATVILIPTVLAEEALGALPTYIVPHIQSCAVFYAENERTARRFFKQVWKEMVIDDYQWHTIHKAEDEVMQSFVTDINAGKTIGVISEAGCPAIADPGQKLVAKAQALGAIIKPLVGPSSILLGLMASGLNGQSFSFHGYLPIQQGERQKAIQQLEIESKRFQRTQIFIETPYRNDQLLEVLLKTLQPQTMLCMAVNLTGSSEHIKTASIADWRKKKPVLGKQPAIFLFLA